MPSRSTETDSLPAPLGVSAAGDKLLHVWDVPRYTAYDLPGHTSKINGLAFFPDNQRVASASSDRTVRVWDAAHGKTELACLEGHRKAVVSVAVSGDGKTVASAGLDDVVIVWDVDEEAERLRVELPKGCAVSVALGSTGSQLLVGGGDGLLRLFSLS